MTDPIRHEVISFKTLDEAEQFKHHLNLTFGDFAFAEEQGHLMSQKYVADLRFRGEHKAHEEHEEGFWAAVFNRGPGGYNEDHVLGLYKGRYGDVVLRVRQQHGSDMYVIPVAIEETKTPDEDPHARCAS